MVAGRAGAPVTVDLKPAVALQDTVQPAGGVISVTLPYEVVQ